MPSVGEWKNHHRSIENIVQDIQYDQELVAGIQERWNTWTGK